MKFKKYVLDLSISIFIYLFTIILVCSLLNVLKIPKYINIIIFMVLLLCGFIIVVINSNISLSLGSEQKVTLATYSFTFSTLTKTPTRNGPS